MFNIIFTLFNLKYLEVCYCCAIFTVTKLNNKPLRKKHKKYNKMKTENEKNPSVGQFVYDTYSRKKMKVHAISDNKIFFIGSEHEPVFRDEFIFPLPKKIKK